MGNPSYCTILRPCFGALLRPNPCSSSFVRMMAATNPGRALAASNVSHERRRTVCPKCNLGLSRWRVWNSIRAFKCPGCGTRLSLHHSPFSRAIVLLFAGLAIVVFWLSRPAGPWSWINLYVPTSILGLVMVGFSIAILVWFGQPAVKRQDTRETPPE